MRKQLILSKLSEGALNQENNVENHMVKRTFEPPRGISTVASFEATEPEKIGSCGSGDIVVTCGTFWT